jgi:hypothetical protein
LENHADLAAANRVEFVPWHSEEITARQQRMTARDSRCAGEQAKDGQRGQALAGSRFSNEADALASSDIEIDATKGADQTLT